MTDGNCNGRDWKHPECALDALDIALGDHALWRGDVVRLEPTGHDYERGLAGTCLHCWRYESEHEPVFRVAPVTQPEPTP